MIKVTKIVSTGLAFYFGGVDTCASCRIRKAEIQKLAEIVSEIAFYEMNAFEVKDLLLEQKISKIPFFMISCDGIIKEIFYTYPSLESLYIKLLKIARSVD